VLQWVTTSALGCCQDSKVTAWKMKEIMKQVRFASSHDYFVTIQPWAAAGGSRVTDPKAMRTMKQVRGVLWFLANLYFLKF
jgi:hypothetical protein